MNNSWKHSVSLGVSHKTRESGMPDEPMWSGFFSPEQTLVRLGLTGSCRDVVDFGCGYGRKCCCAKRIASCRTVDGLASCTGTTIRPPRAGHRWTSVLAQNDSEF